MDLVFLMAVFFTPISVLLSDADYNIGLALPTEPILFGLLIIYCIKLISQKNIDIRIFKHPVTIAILLHLLWMMITSLTSEMPIISIKYFLSRLWFVVAFYFIALEFFKKGNNYKSFIWAYSVPLLLVIVYSLYRLSNFGFIKIYTYSVMSPFYNDHTAYGAAIAMIIPVIIGYLITSLVQNKFKPFLILLLAFLAMALLFSYSRAAWISLIAALMFSLVVYYKVSYRFIMFLFSISVILFFVYQEDIISSMGKNKVESSTDIAEHARSISNISSDASNLERFNRWNSAIALYNARPIVGWGPGTYQFVYGPYQSNKDKTIISTNFGDVGNAHSEYLGPLSESGLPGLLFFLLILINVFYFGIKLYFRSQDKKVKSLAIITLSALVTYVLHGVLNNFLDTDKASALFWGYIAIIVSLDLSTPETK